MKKLFTFFILLLLVLTGCSHNNSNLEETHSDNMTNNDVMFETEANTENVVTDNTKDDVDTNIESISIEIIGLKKEITISQSIIDDFEKAKTANKPILDELDVQKFGTVNIKEKGKDEYVFGEIYSNISGKYYLHYIDNPNNAVVELELNVED